jgi:hypothetical protein
MAKPGRKPKSFTAATDGTGTEAGGKGETISSYFRKIFEENTDLLDSRSNEELLRRWLADHPDETTVSDRIKQNLANIKSVLRKKLRGPAKGKKVGRPAKTVVAQEKLVASKPIRELERLEEQIDDCLTFAKRLDRDNLGSVISHLRRARNDVVWRLGQ